eukprot:9499373-Pyramimonas_sp.AAC.1
MIPAVTFGRMPVAWSVVLMSKYPVMLGLPQVKCEAQSNCLRDSSLLWEHPWSGKHVKSREAKNTSADTLGPKS